MNTEKISRRLNKQITVLVIGIAAAMLFLNISFLFRPLLDHNTDSEIIVSRGAHIIMCIFIGLILYMIHEFVIPLIPRNDFKKPDFRVCTWGILGVIVVIAVIQRIAVLVNCVIDCSLITAGNVNQELYSGLAVAEKIVYIAATSMVVPLMEEVIFRGLIFGALGRLSNMHTAAVVSALFFGILHGVSLFTVISTGIMGLILAYIYGIYKNLGNCICIHAGYNFMVVFTLMMGQAL